VIAPFGTLVVRAVAVRQAAKFAFRLNATIRPGDRISLWQIAISAILPGSPTARPFTVWRPPCRYRYPAQRASVFCALCIAAIIPVGLRSFCCSATRGQEMQTVVAIMLIGSVVMVAIAALDHPRG
jgi:hypothetical protein